MNEWLRIAITISAITSHMPPISFTPHASSTVTVTRHPSRAAAIEAEAVYRVAHPSRVDTWDESYMEWNGSFYRHVILVNGATVEELRFEPKTKGVIREVQVPDGTRPVTTPAEEER